MITLLPLIIAVLFYKIKLIDDRKNINFEKFKNYRKLRSNPPKHGLLFEQDAWLEKDIQYQLIAYYEANKTNEGEKWAVLDYYKDFRDNEQARIHAVILISTISLYLLVSNCWTSPKFWQLLIETGLIIPSLIVCFKQAERSIFNNPAINVGNSQISKIKYLGTQMEIERDIADITKKFQIK